MDASEDTTQRISQAELEEEAAARVPLSERSLKTIFDRVFQFHWFGNEERPTADVAVRTEVLRERLGTESEDVREFWRAAASGLAELGAQVGRLVDIGGGGACVSTARPLQVGAVIQARLTDEEGGWTYEFPCVVVWVEGDPDPRAGLRFIGKPRRVRLD